MFRGSIVAIVTPMHMDGSIDYPALAKLIEWHILSGTAAVVVSGTTGESATLTYGEQADLIGFVVRTVAGRIPVIAGTGVPSTAKSIELTKQAMALGADACLLMAPAYVKPTQEGLYRHYRAIAEAVPIPQILYNVPGRTACDILPETVARLAKLPNIIGIKEATGQLERLEALKALCADDMDFFSGDDITAKDFMLAGGKGVISVTANVAPKQMHALCEAALAGDKTRANQLDAILQPLHHAVFVEANPIPVKWAVSQLGFITEGIRLPLTPLSVAKHDEVHAALISAGVEFPD